MLKNETTRQDRQRGAVDLLWIDGHNRHAEEIPDGGEEALLVYFTGVKHLSYPRTAVWVRG